MPHPDTGNAFAYDVFRFVRQPYKGLMASDRSFRAVGPIRWNSR
jgi:hypothetical protein